MNIIYKEIEKIPEFIEAIRIRVDVFIIEQKCPPGWEPDEYDAGAKHFIAIADDKIVATTRLLDDKKGTATIGRMVVRKDHRGHGIGLGLTKYLIEQAKKLGYKKVVAIAQTHAQKMYEKAGFKTTSKEHDLYGLGIMHVDMEYVFE